MPCDDASSSRRVQRFEVFTGAGRRRDWGPLKAAIIAESYSGLESVSAVARRHGIAPSQLFTWRRQRRKAPEAQDAAPSVSDAPCFVPAILEPAPVSVAALVTKPSRRRRRSRKSAIELDIDGVAVRIAPGADRELIRVVIDALKAS